MWPKLISGISTIRYLPPLIVSSIGPSVATGILVGSWTLFSERQTSKGSSHPNLPQEKGILSLHLLQWLRESNSARWWAKNQKKKKHGKALIETDGSNINGGSYACLLPYFSHHQTNAQPFLSSANCCPILLFLSTTCCRVPTQLSTPTLFSRAQTVPHETPMLCLSLFPTPAPTDLPLLRNHPAPSGLDQNSVTL